MKEIIQGLENQEQTTTPPATTKTGQVEVKKEETGKILEKTLDKLVDKVVSRAGAGTGDDGSNAVSSMLEEVVSYCLMGLGSVLVSCLVYFFPRQVKWIRKKFNKLKQTDDNRQGASADNPPPPPTPSLIDL